MTSTKEISSGSDYINCVTLTSDSISTVEHRENAQEICAEMILKGKDCGATKPSWDLRIYIDQKELNKALKQERYPIPATEDVLPELSKARVFTKVDARNGYWHMVLDEESVTLTTFDTPIGYYYWRRLPIGLGVLSENFQKQTLQALDGLSGLHDVHDDMVIYGVGDTGEQADGHHDRNLERFLQRCRQQRNQAKRIEAQTQVHRILLPRTPLYQRGPDTRPGQDKCCARNAATGQHQSSQKILWIRQLLSKFYAETKWSHGVY